MIVIFLEIQFFLLNFRVTKYEIASPHLAGQAQGIANTKKELYNAIGKLVYTTIKDVIEVSLYAKGMYYLRCEKEVKKVIIE